jgi:ketosteroid isomerase-like protein
LFKAHDTDALFTLVRISYVSRRGSPPGIRQFYAALERFLNGDSEPMMEVWSHGPDVTTMHSAPGRQVGWEEVRTAWQQFASLTSGGQVTVHDLLVRVGGDLAYTVGIEPIEATLAGERGQFEGRVTNIYRREEGAGRWCIITLISPPRCRTS